MHILTAGVDEAGRGPLVGSVFAAAVILPEIFDLPGLTDSKKLSEKKRDALAEMIKNRQPQHPARHHARDETRR